jgi:hypothetical protein
MGCGYTACGENGLGFTTEQASAEVAVLKRLFVLLPESPLLEEWARLVAKIPSFGQEHSRCPAGSRNDSAWSEQHFDVQYSGFRTLRRD